MTRAIRKPKSAPIPSRAAASRSARKSSRAQLDPLVHERMRLAILGALSVQDSLSFRELRTALDTTDGNLSVHCRRLEDAAYIAVRKRFADRVPRTEYSITSKGRGALQDYLAHMDRLISELRG